MGNYTKMVAIGLIASAAVVTGTSKASADSMVTIRYRAKVGHKVYKIADKRVKKNKIIKYQSKKLIGGYHQKSAVKVKANKNKTVYLAYTNKYKVKYYTNVGRKRYALESRVYTYNQKVAYKSAKIIKGYHQTSSKKFIVTKDLSVTLPYNNKYKLTITRVTDDGKTLGSTTRTVVYNKATKVVAPAVSGRGVVGQKSMYVKLKEDNKVTFKYAPYQTLSFTLKDGSKKPIANRSIVFKSISNAVTVKTDASGGVTAKFLRSAKYSTNGTGINTAFTYNVKGNTIITNKTGYLSEGVQTGVQGAVAQTTADTVVMDKSDLTAYKVAPTKNNKTTVAITNPEVKATVGDNLVLPATPDMPSGIMGKVVSASNDGKTVTMEPVPVTDVYKDLSLPADDSLLTDKNVIIHYPTDSSGNTGTVYADDAKRKVTFSNVRDGAFKGGFQLGFNGLELGLTKNTKVEIEGTLNIKASSSGVHYTGGDIKNTLNSTMTVTDASDATFKLTGDAMGVDLNKDIYLMDIVIPQPVAAIEVKVPVYLHAEMNVSGDVEFKLTSPTMSTTAGIVAGKPAFNRQETAPMQYSLTANANYKGALGLGADIQINPVYDKVSEILMLASWGDDTKLKPKGEPGTEYTPLGNDIADATIVTAGIALKGQVSGELHGGLKGTYDGGVKNLTFANNSKASVSLGLELDGRIYSNPFAGLSPTQFLIKLEQPLFEDKMPKFEYPKEDDKTDISKLSDKEKLALTLMVNRLKYKNIPTSGDIRNGTYDEMVGMDGSTKKVPLNSIEFVKTQQVGNSVFYKVSPSDRSAQQMIMLDGNNAYVFGAQNSVTPDQVRVDKNATEVDLQVFADNFSNSPVYKQVLNSIFIGRELQQKSKLWSDFGNWLGDYAAKQGKASQNIIMHGAVSGGNFYIRTSNYKQMLFATRYNDDADNDFALGTPFSNAIGDCSFTMYMSDTGKTGFYDPTVEYGLAGQGMDIRKGTGTNYVLGNDGVVYEAKSDYYSTFAGPGSSPDWGTQNSSNGALYSPTKNKDIQAEYTNLLNQYDAYK